jgi:hypothetical protein
MINEDLHEDLLIGSVDGSMIDDDILFQTTRTQYLGIENKMSPESFYDLSALSTVDRFRPVKIHARIGIIAYTLMSTFRMEAMKMSEADMIRGLVSIGLIALCKQKNINFDLIESTIELYSGQRQISMDKRFNVTLELLDFNSASTVDIVSAIVCGRPRNDKYGVLLWNRLHQVWSKKTPEYTKSRKWCVSPNLLKKCRSFTKDGLSDKMYELKNKSKNNSVDSQNPSITIRISRRFTILSYEYNKFYGAGRLPGQLFRGYFNAGLFILSKWALQKKLSNYEYMFKHMIHDLEIQACVKQSQQ